MAYGKFNWTVVATKLLISEYESCEFLYNSKHNDYRNRQKRVEAYDKIALAINNIQDGCTALDVKKKLNGLRSQYLGEKSKIAKSIKSGASEDDLYKPTIYWFPLFKFLDTVTNNADESQSNLDNSHFQSYNSQFQSSQSISDALEDMDTISINSIDNVAATSTSRTFSKRKKHNPAEEPECLITTESTTMREVTEPIRKERVDSFETFANFVESELRDINAVSNELVCRQVKRKIQHVILDAWEQIDISHPISITLESYSTHLRGMKQERFGGNF